jgi:DegV family protein with EDD domain
MMRDFVITVNSTVDMPKEWLEERNIKVVPLHYTMDGTTYEDMNGLSAKEFFAKLREGKMSVTSQVNPDEAREALEPLVKEGKDILHLAFTSVLSGTYNSMRLAAEELREDYPEAKIIVVDTLCACMGEGLLAHYAYEMKRAGKTIEETAQWIEDNKLRVGHQVTVDDLHHLHRGGRVSKASAVVGSMVKIKPILIVNDEGKLVVEAKERGRKKSINTIVNMAIERMGEADKEIAFVTHGDCLEEAEYLAELLKEKAGVKEVLINNIGTVIGSHTGPGVLAVFHMGNKR